MWQKWNSTQRVIAILAGSFGLFLAAVLVLLVVGLAAPRFGAGQDLPRGIAQLSPESSMPGMSIGANGRDFMASGYGLSAARAKAAMDTMGNQAAPAAEMAMNSAGGRQEGQFSQGDGPMLKPQLIKEANMTLKVEKLAPAVQRIRLLVSSLGGYATMENLSLSEGESLYRAGSMTVRLPASQLDRFLENAGDIGQVLNENISAQDVSRELVDTESRIRNLQAEEKALQQIMGRAGKISDVLEVARELSRVRGEIEHAQGQLTYMRGQVAYSTVNMSITEKILAPAVDTQPGIGDTAFNSLQKSWGALYGLILKLIELAIWVGVAGLPVTLVFTLCVWGLTQLAIAIFRRLKEKNSGRQENQGSEH